MTDFNYSQLHIFDKKGNELPLVFDTNFKIEIPNNLTNDNAIFYGVLNPDNTVSNYYCKYQGGRYNQYCFIDNHIDENGYGYISCNLILPNSEKIPFIAKVKVIAVDEDSYYNTSVENISEEDNDKDKYKPYYITEIIPEETVIDYESYDIKYPSITFNSGVIFDKVSTDLVETQSLYVLVEENNEFIKISEATDNSWRQRYKLLFFIDCQKQEDFRFFTLDGDEVVWTNKIVLDSLNGDYRVDIGFSTNIEGIYEQPIIVCLIDSEVEGEDGKPGLITPIGSIQMSAEAIGEDERYRTLFTNFGLPHPSEYMKVFKDTDLNEGYTDNIKMNEKAKMLFLSYTDIFPYVGTYKALINAVKLLNYDDVFFKEWYKIVGKDVKQGGYVSYDMQYHADMNANTINNLTIEQRIHLRKMNWISMIYKINEELSNKGEDRWGFPYTKTVHSYDDRESLIKLISLKDWLQKYIIGVNCRIIDVGGEGIYYERYRLDSYASYQNIIEWNNIKNIAPYFEHIENQDILVDSSAKILVNIGISDEHSTLESIQKDKIIDFCEGYIDSSANYHNLNDYSINENDTEDYIFVGGTFECTSHLNRYELRATSKVDNFLFNDDFIYNNNDASINSSRLRITNDEIEFNTIDIFNNKPKTTIFKAGKCPIIQLEKANLRIYSKSWNKSIQYEIYPDLSNDTLISYFIKNEITGEVQSTIDYITLLPPEFIDETDEYIRLRPYNSKIDYTIDDIIINKLYKNEIISDYENGPVSEYNKENITYGLTYSADNVYNLPFFTITGYQIDKIENNISYDTEYILEILDGKMIFTDYDNDRTIYLNFNFDTDSKKQTVEVNIVYNSNQFYPVSYLDSSYINNFIDNNNYETFVNNYNENIDNAICYNFIKDLKVNNSGEFTVDVFGFDIHNNIFAANCDGKEYIKMPDFKINVYTNNPVEGDETGKLLEDNKLEESFIDFCIYKPTYLISGITPKIDDKNKSISIIYPTYSYSLHTPAEGEYLHFINITDRFNIKAIDNIETYTFLTNNGVITYEGYTLISDVNCPKRYNRILESNDFGAITGLNNNVEPDYDETKRPVSEYLNKFYDASLSYSDVNLIFYNELGGYPIIQTYANMANEHAFYKVDAMKENYLNSNYRIHVSDDSWRGYVWSSIKETERSILINNLSQLIAMDSSIVNFVPLEVKIDNYKLPYETLEGENEEGEEEDNTRYIEVLFKNYYNTIKDLSNALFNNFELGSINDPDNKKRSTGAYELNPNYNFNKTLNVSINNIDDLTTINHDFYEFINRNSEITNNDCQPVPRENNLDPETSCYYSYELFDVYNNSYNITYPYKEETKEFISNLLLDIETTLFKYNYDDILESEIMKLVADYTLKDNTNLSIIEKISSEFLDSSIIENTEGNVQYETLYTSSNLYDIMTYRKGLDIPEVPIRDNYETEEEYENALMQYKNISVINKIIDIWEQGDDTSSEWYNYFYGDEIIEYIPLDFSERYTLDSSLDHFSVHKLFFDSKFLSNVSYSTNYREEEYKAVLRECDPDFFDEYTIAGDKLNLPVNAENFLKRLAKYDHGYLHINDIKSFIDLYLNDSYVHSDIYNSIIVETLLESLKDKTKIDNNLYSKVVSVLCNKLIDNDEIYTFCKDDSLFINKSNNTSFGQEKNIYETVCDSNNFLYVYPDEDIFGQIDGSVYINSNGYKLVTDNITIGSHELQIGDFLVDNSKNIRTRIAFIERVKNNNNYTYYVKTINPICSFDKTQYLYPVNYKEIPITVYENEYYEYVKFDNYSSLTEFVPPKNKLYALTEDDNKLWEYVYYDEEDLEGYLSIDDLENVPDSSKIEYKDIKYVINIKHFSPDEMIPENPENFDENHKLIITEDTLKYFEYSETLIIKEETLLSKNAINIIKNNGNYSYSYYDNDYINDNICDSLTDIINDYNDNHNNTDYVNNGIFIYNPNNSEINNQDSSLIINYFIIQKEDDNNYPTIWLSKQYIDEINTFNENKIYINYYFIVDKSENKLPAIYELVGETINESNITFNKFTNYENNDIAWNEDLEKYEYNNVLTISRLEETHHIIHLHPDSSIAPEGDNKYGRIYRVEDASYTYDVSIAPYLDVNGYHFDVPGYWRELKDVDANDISDTSIYIIKVINEKDNIFVPSEIIYDVFSYNKISEPSITYNKEDVKCYITSNGYSVNIHEDKFNSLLTKAGYYITDNDNNITNEKIRINKINYDDNTKEYKLLLDNRIYKFSQEEYNETYLSKHVSLIAHQAATKESDINIIKTNLQCIYVNCLLSMNDITSGAEALVQDNIKKYYASQYVYLSWILIALIDNIRKIVELKSQEANYTYELSDVYIYHYLALTDPYVQKFAYSIVTAYCNGLLEYFYSTDSIDTSTGKMIANSLYDDLYNETSISLYDKLLTASSKEALTRMKEKNWALTGEIHVKDESPIGMYAVVTHKNKYENKIEDIYESEFNEISYDSIFIKDSVSISEESIPKIENIFPDDDIIDVSTYYVKQGNNVKFGYSEVTKETPENATTSIQDLASASYISPYIKPIWAAEIRLGLIDKKIIKNSPLDDSFDYMYVTFKDNTFKTTFNIGEKVKIIFESEENKNYIGQSTYEVVGYDITNNSIIIKGYINEEYLSGKQEEVWSTLYTDRNEDNTFTILSQIYPKYVPIIKDETTENTFKILKDAVTNEWEISSQNEEGQQLYFVIDSSISPENTFEINTTSALDGNIEYVYIYNNIIYHEYEIVFKDDERGNHLYFIKTDNIITVNDSYYSLRNVEIKAYDEHGNFTGETNIINLRIPIKYVAKKDISETDEDSVIVDENISIDELTDGSELSSYEDITWLFRIYAILPSGRTIMPVSIYADTSEKIKMYISYAHHSYVDYSIPVLDSVENTDGTTTVNLKYDAHTRRLFDFIDDTFSITSREFDIKEGIGAWMNSKRNTIKLNDSVPDICQNPIYEYKNISPELTENNNLIAFSINLENTGINENEYVNYWKVYKKSLELDKDILAFESFNPILYLDYNDKGIYSIESFVCDKYGNTASKYYKGIYKIK